MDIPRITVVTPTFNRAHTLPRLYESLLEQTYKGFRWLVVDDGSADGTSALLEQWQRTSPFVIDCVSQENSGMYVAINRGIARVETELCAVIGSDDWYVHDGLERLLRHWDSIPPQSKDEFANVEGRTALADGSLNGGSLPAPIIDSDHYEASVLHNWSWDTCGLWRSEVRKAYPFPEDLGRVVIERLVFYRVARRYRTRYCSDVVARVDYQPGGLSELSSDAEVIVSAAPAWLAFTRELLTGNRPMPAALRVRAHANEIRFACHLRQGPIQQFRQAPGRIGWMLSLPLGFALYARDRLRVRAKRSAGTPG